MNDADKPQFLKVLNGMASMKKQPLTPEVLDLWWACMSEWTIEDFKAAAIHVLKSTTFMSTPKDFEDLRKAGRPTAGECWERAVDHAANSRFRRGIKLDEMTERVVAQIGGFEQIAMTDRDKLPFLEKRFAERFDEYQDVHDTREELPALTLDAVLKLRHQQ